MPFLSKKQVMKRTSLSYSTIWRHMRTGDFPQSRKLSSRRVGWLESEIEEWEASRPKGIAILPDNLK